MGQWQCSPSPSGPFHPARHSLPEDRGRCVSLETAKQNNRKTILIVDDDPLIVRTVTAILHGQGFDIITAESGAEALEKSGTFDGEIALLLTDFEMANMAGIELATRLTELRPAIKVLMMSGFNGGMLILNEGWHFLTKPFLASQLRAMVVTLIFPDRESRFGPAQAPA